MLREVFPHACLQSTVKVFNKARLCLFVMGRNIIHSLNSQKLLFKNSTPLSVYNVVGLLLSVSSWRNALTSDVPDLLINGRQQFLLEKTSVTVRKKVTPSLYLFRLNWDILVYAPLMRACVCEHVYINVYITCAGGPWPRGVITTDRVNRDCDVVSRLRPHVEQPTAEKRQVTIIVARSLDCEGVRSDTV